MQKKKKKKKKKRPPPKKGQVINNYEPGHQEMVTEIDDG